MPEVKEGTIVLSNMKRFEIQPVDASKLYVDTSSAAFLDIQKDNENHISCISIEGKYDIKVGDKFSIEIGAVSSVYEIKYMIVEKGQKSILMFSSVPNKTTTFLLPLLGITKNQLKFDYYFVNAFLNKELDHLYLLYRFTGTRIYKDFEQTMWTNPLCVKHVESDKYHVIYIFKIPERFEEDVEHFKNGHYSKFSKTLRQRIMKFYGSADASMVMQVVNQDKELKTKLEEHLNLNLPDASELASKPDLELEIYNII